MTNDERALLQAFRSLPADWQDVLAHAIRSLADENTHPIVGRQLTDGIQVVFTASEPRFGDDTRSVIFIRNEGNPDDGPQIVAYRVPIIN